MLNKEFAKSLFIAIIVPIAASSFTFASKYGAYEESQAHQLAVSQTILSELKSNKLQIDDVNILVASQSQTLKNVEDKVADISVSAKDLNNAVIELQTSSTHNKEQATYLRTNLENMHSMITKLDRDVGILQAELKNTNDSIKYRNQ